MHFADSNVQCAHVLVVVDLDEVGFKAGEIQQISKLAEFEPDLNRFDLIGLEAYIGDDGREEGDVRTVDYADAQPFLAPR